MPDYTPSDAAVEAADKAVSPEVQWIIEHDPGEDHWGGIEQVDRLAGAYQMLRAAVPLELQRERERWEGERWAGFKCYMALDYFVSKGIIDDPDADAAVEAYAALPPTSKSEVCEVCEGSGEYDDGDGLTGCYACHGMGDAAALPTEEGPDA